MSSYRQHRHYYVISHNAYTQRWIHSPNPDQKDSQNWSIMWSTETFKTFPLNYITKTKSSQSNKLIYNCLSMQAHTILVVEFCSTPTLFFILSFVLWRSLAVDKFIFLLMQNFPWEYCGNGLLLSIHFNILSPHFFFVLVPPPHSLSYHLYMQRNCCKLKSLFSHEQKKTATRRIVTFLMYSTFILTTFKEQQAFNPPHPLPFTHYLA